MSSPTPISRNLHIHLTGTFRLDFQGRSIQLPTRKTKSLLSYLILHPGAHNREKLATLFWGDSTDSAARGSLRKALTFLRKHIDEDLILSDNETAQINPSFPVWVDLYAFEQQAEGLLSVKAAQADQFKNLPYDGDLLTDFYDEWILTPRVHYQNLYIDVMLRGVEQARVQSEYKLAIKFAQKILVCDPANERTHQHLMFCYITLGERKKALEQYEACQHALQDELGVNPTQETQALNNWIKQHELDTPSLAARITNLPIPISSFVGRGRELSKIKGLLSSVRLVTLTGPGGSGKTRLAIHAATDLIDSYRDGIWWVELAPVVDPKLVPFAVAKALGIDGRSDQLMMETLKKYLNSRKALILLDNCEHLIEASAHLTETLLNECADLKVLATSREALGLVGENVWVVPTLSLPEPQKLTHAELLLQYESIQLFVERASAVRQDFRMTDENAYSVAQICMRLDGIPLAIELAAARVKMIPVEQIAARLDDRFQFLTAPIRAIQGRHQTLRATVDWSYELLSEKERQLFNQLSVFAGGWTLEAAEAICSGEGFVQGEILDLLAHLVDKSLVTITAEGRRYGMLETIRQYGNENLIQSRDQDRVFRQFLEYYLKMAKVGDEKIRGPEQIRWHKLLRSEQDNLRSAIGRALNSTETLEQGCELVCAMIWHWGMVGDFVTMKHWLQIALLRSSELGRTPTRAKVLFNAGSISVEGLNWLEPIDAKTLIEESLEVWSGLDHDFFLEKAKCKMILGYIQKRFFDDDNGFDSFQLGVDVFHKTDNYWWNAWALNLSVLMLNGDPNSFQIIQKVWEEETSLWNKVGDRWGKSQPIMDLGLMEFEQGNFITAEKHFQECLRTFNEFDSKGYIIQILPRLGDIARVLKQYDRAKTYYMESIPIAKAIMWDFILDRIYLGLGYVSLFKGDEEQSEEYFFEALKMSQEYEHPRRQILCIAGFASRAVFRGDLRTGARLFGAFFTQIKNLQIELKEDKIILEPVDEIEINKYFELCKNQLDKATFEQVWNLGVALSLDEVMTEIMRVDS